MINRIKDFSLIFFVLLFNSAFCQGNKVTTINDNDSIPVRDFHSRIGVNDSIVYIKDWKKTDANLKFIRKYVGGNKERTLIYNSSSGASSAKNNIQVKLNANDTVVHKTIETAHEFEHVVRGGPSGNYKH